MNFQLSNYEFRAFVKATGFVSLHLRTQVLFETNASFSIDAYLRDIAGALRLSDGTTFPVGEGVSIGSWTTIEYDGHTQVHELTIPVHTALRQVRDCLGDLELEFQFDFHGAEIRAHHTHPVFVRRIRNAAPPSGRRSGGR